MSEQVGGIYYSVTLDTKGLINGEREVKRRLDKIGTEGDRLQARFTAVAAGITAALSAIAVEGIVSKLVTAQRQFDVMFASLKTMTGGAKEAGAEFERLRVFASKTPYSVEQAVQAFVKLKALGLDPSERAMMSFGNTASAMGKDLKQMIEAVADASTGEFERLKEFGIKAKKEGENVSLTFRGTTTTIANDAASIVDYLTNIGETDFAGAMSERMKTLDGDISNLEDSLATLYLTISQSGFGDAVAAGVRKATEAIQEIGTSVKEGGLTEYFAALRPYITAAEVAVVSLAGAITSRLLAAFIASATQAYASAAAVGAASVASRGFMSVIAAMGGPVGIAITGLALLALNWEKVGGEATDAATMSEQAADRIAAALKKSGGRAGKELMTQMSEVQREISDIEKELARTSFPKADPAQLDELRARRDTLQKIAADIATAMGKTAGSGDRRELARRGRPAEPFGEAGATPDKKPDDKPSAPKFDAAAYLAGLAEKATDEWTKVGIIEQEALRKNAALLAEGKLTFAQAEEGKVQIARAAAQKREDIGFAEATENLRRIEQSGKDEQAARDKLAADQAKGQAFAIGIKIEDDPIAKLQVELETKSALLMQYAATDQENAALYAEAKVALEQQTYDRIKEIRDKERADQVKAQTDQLSAYGSLFGGLADLTKAYAGEQSSTYKKMFAVSKAFAIAEAIVNIQAAVTKAANAPYPQNIAQMGVVLGATAGLISTIKGTNFGGGRQYGGPVSSDSLYRVNETGRPEMFTAANGAQYMLPTSSGNVTPANQVGGSGGGNVIELRVINQVPGVSVSQRNGTDGRPELVIAEIANQIRENQGPVWSAMRSSTNIEGRI